jgi:hypothetical protein
VSSIWAIFLPVLFFYLCSVCDFEHAHGDSWDERVANELDTIARHNPDIIGMQEPIFRADVKQLTPKGYKAIYFDKADWLPWGVYPDAVIMFKESRFIQKDFNMFWLGPNSSFPAGKSIVFFSFLL